MHILISDQGPAGLHNSLCYASKICLLIFIYQKTTYLYM